MSAWRRRRYGLRSNVAARSSRTRTVRSARRGPRSGRWRRILWVCAALLVGWAAAAGYRVGAPKVHDWLRIEQVQVTGLHRISRDAVIQRLAIPPRASLLTVSPTQLEERLSGHPWIKQASVRRMPLHTLAVEVTERRPAVIVKGKGQAYLVSEEGHVLSVVPEGQDAELPVLVGVDPRRLLVGDEQPRQAALSGIRLATLLGERYQGKTEVDVSNPDNAVAYVRGLRFQFGDMPFDGKWERYRRLESTVRAHLEETRRPGRGEIDLRYPGKVIVRERG
ncbi:MAG: cell division protein FtsQ/DivIB [Nitrospirales bacterium]